MGDMVFIWVNGLSNKTYGQIEQMSESIRDTYNICRVVVCEDWN